MRLQVLSIAQSNCRNILQLFQWQTIASRNLFSDRRAIYKVVSGSISERNMAELNEEDPCAEHERRIRSSMDQLKRRYADMRKDRRDLYRIRRTGVDSWLGHQQQFLARQSSLRQQIKDSIKDQCEPLHDAWNWATRRPPSKPEPRT